MSSSGNPMAFAVPVRTSSKRGRSPDKSLSELEEAQRLLSMEIKSAFKKVKPSESFDFNWVNNSYALVIIKLISCFNTYWTDRTEVLPLKKRSIKLRSKISMQHFRNNNRPGEITIQADLAEMLRLAKQIILIETKLFHRLFNDETISRWLTTNVFSINRKGEGVLKNYLFSGLGLDGYQISLQKIIKIIWKTIRFLKGCFNECF